MAVLQNTVLAAVIIVVGSTALAVIGLLATLRLTPRTLREEDTEVKAAFLSIVGVMYAILLAFVVVAVWSDFTDAGTVSQEEVTRLSNLMRDAGAMPPAERVELRTGVLDYARAVVDDEWPAMAQGRESQTARAAYASIWSSWYRLKPSTESQRAFYSEAVSRLNDLGADRRIRIIASRSTVAAPLWILLIAGFALSVVFTYLFDFSSVTIHVLSVAAITALTAFVLFLIYSLQHPFAGSIAVTPTPFVELLHQWPAGSLARA
jgi:uncharacterized protein DUF4239